MGSREMVYHIPLLRSPVPLISLFPFPTHQGTGLGGRILALRDALHHDPHQTADRLGVGVNVASAHPDDLLRLRSSRLERFDGLAR